MASGRPRFVPEGVQAVTAPGSWTKTDQDGRLFKAVLDRKRPVTED